MIPSKPAYTQSDASTPVSGTTVTMYNALGEVTAQADSLGDTTQYAYDQLWHRTSRTDYNANVANQAMGIAKNPGTRGAVGAKVDAAIAADETARINVTEAADPAATLETAVRQRASDVIASQSIRVRGPVLSGAMDTKTGDMFFGQNTGIPDPLHPDLQQLLEDFPGPGAPGKGIPGSHAEINALN